MIPMIGGDQRTILKILENSLGVREIQLKTETVQTIVLRRLARILRRVLDRANTLEKGTIQAIDK